MTDERECSTCGTPGCETCELASELLQQRRAHREELQRVEARVRAEVAKDLRAAFVPGAMIPAWAQPGRRPRAELVAEWAAQIALGSSPDTTPEPPKVKLWTAWVPFAIAAENHPFTDEQRKALAGHEDHQTGGAWSAFGWRSLACTTCDVTLWSITTPEAKP